MQLLLRQWDSAPIEQVEQALKKKEKPGLSILMLQGGFPRGY